jgi:hypothetical protein
VDKAGVSTGVDSTGLEDFALCVDATSGVEVGVGSGVLEEAATTGPIVVYPPTGPSKVFGAVT